MKAIWKGSISFGLVSIPVILYSGTKSNSRVSFHMLHKTCKTPLKYKKWCETDDQEVEWKDVVKGLEIAQDTYFILSQEELQKLRPQKTSTINLIGFVDHTQIDDIYMEKSYFVAPQNEKDKAYFLFREAISNAARYAVGDFIMHEKEHLCMIKSYKNGMLLTTLKYANEVRDINDIEGIKGAKIKITPAEMKLAEELISKLEIKDFDIKEYKETFNEELKELIKKKLAGEKIEPEETEKPKKDMNLLKALKASIK